MEEIKNKKNKKERERERAMRRPRGRHVLSLEKTLILPSMLPERKRKDLVGHVLESWCLGVRGRVTLAPAAANE